MAEMTIPRRDFLRTLLAGTAVAALDWTVLPRAASAKRGKAEYDAVIIGSGLGGLSIAAAFARQGFRPLVLEQHYQPGGYAHTFKRGDFVFDVSLHSTTVGERGGIHNLIPGFPEIKEVEFVPHPNLYRVIYPDFDIRVRQRNLRAYIDMLTGYFPDQRVETIALLEEMKGIAADVRKYSAASGKVDMKSFPIDFPHLYKAYNRTWGELVDMYIIYPKLKAILSTLWGYYGLPPSKLASIYYALPTISYLSEGGYYPRGTCKKITDAFVKFIEDRGGQVMLRTEVDKVLVDDQAATGVQTKDGKRYTARVVISNANAYDTFQKMVPRGDYLKEYLGRMDYYSVSLSSFQIFLGLKEDLVGRVGIPDTEIFYETGYDLEAAYESALAGDVDNGGYGLTLYDNLYDGYSPKGKNTLNIIVLQGYQPWEKYEGDYRKGKKEAYHAQKERMAAVLIKRVEETLLPGLSRAIEVKEIGTPLTNVRFTRNYRGAIYGWDQTLGNSGKTRLPHKTPVKNLYLSGAWTSPGHGYTGVIYSGLECFGEIMQDW
jgi:all-trans-retinol 13,14-reductase